MKNLILLLSLFLCGTLSVKSQKSMDIYSYQSGEFKIILLSEAQQNASPGILIGTTPEMLAKYVPGGTFPNAMNAFVVQGKGKNILIDTGLGIKLFENLKSVGLQPGDIDVILITHMHGDHIGGLIQNGEVMFPSVQLYIPQPEHDYWMSDDEMYQVPENSRMSFTNARNVIRQYGNRLHLFEPNKLEDITMEILPGIKPIAAYGHTPGHTVYLLESGNSRFLVWGDLTHAMAIQMPYPEIAVTYDVNPELAIESREAILKYVKDYRIPIAGMHIAFPGMGKIITGEEEGYKFIEF
ncbi:MAG: MBL fold metallo-hydrolase [Tannerellaceae bacterium]|nr:MBL fold metallo-hydrolase [Tannerellaceae bacterium]